MIDAQHLQSWIGREERSCETLAAEPLARLAAVLDYPEVPWIPRQVPPLAHWLYFLPTARARDIGADGHPRLGEFLPPVPLPRRMWAGSRVEFLQPLLTGEAVERCSRITAVEHKVGKSGELVFVSVEHLLSSPRGLLLREVQDLVYRAPDTGTHGAASSSAEALPAFDWSRELQPDPVMLMRFSALTFNAHRIHYDRDYARDIEGYAGLVVHGPLTASLLMDTYLRQHPEADVAAFRFRGLRPLPDTGPLTLAGHLNANGAELWALDSAGQVAMRATVELR